MEPLSVLVVVVLVSAYGLFSARLEGSLLTPPMAFTAFGLLIGPYGLGLFHTGQSNQALHIVAELTLVIVLYTDASRINLSLLKGGYNLPLRMLALGLPLTVLLGAGAAWLLWPQMGLWGACLLAAILAPTDAALGQAVMANPRVPALIRQGLNVESGLNDGLALPLVLVFIALATLPEVPQGQVGHWALLWAGQVILGPLTGGLVGWAGGRLLDLGLDRQWMNRLFSDIMTLSLAFVAYYLAQVLGGNGLMACFTAGLVLAQTSRDISSRLWEFAEAEGQILVLLTFLCFGADLVWPALTGLDWRIALYCLASLTLLRMLPVAVSLLGTGLRPVSHLFLGWFGPRGVATILFGLLALEEQGIPGARVLLEAFSFTALVSIYVHGLSAAPAAAAYAARLGRLGPGLAETAPVPELPVRLPLRRRRRGEG